MKTSFTPVLFIGMHRSGTSLLGHLLEQCGLFMGTKKDDNNEAVLFQRLNKWLLAQCGARWDTPEAISYLWQGGGEAPRRKAEAYVRDLLGSPRSALFLGWRRYACYRSVFKLEEPWGWKDPRNTFTLPFWQALFPQARIVFIERHGVDVAESLRIRAERSMTNSWRRYEKGRRVAWLRPKRGGFTESPRCHSLEGGFSLWELYQRQAHRVLEVLPAERVFNVRYEDLLNTPQKILGDACTFCGVSASDARIREVTASIHAGRAYAYRDDIELVQFAEAHKQHLYGWRYRP